MPQKPLRSLDFLTKFKQISRPNIFWILKSVIKYHHHVVTQFLMDYMTWQREKASWDLRCSRTEGVIILKFDGLMEYIYTEMFPHSSIHLFHSFLGDSSNIRDKLSGCRQVIILLHVLIHTTRLLYLPYFTQ